MHTLSHYNQSIYILGDGEMGGEKKITLAVLDILSLSYNVTLLRLFPSWSISSNLLKNVLLFISLCRRLPMLLSAPPKTIIYSSHSFAIVLGLIVTYVRRDMVTVFHYHGTKESSYSAKYHNPIKIIVTYVATSVLNLFHRFCENISLNYCDYLIVPTIKDVHLTKDQAHRAIVIPSFVDLSVFAYQRKVSHKKLIIGYLSRVTYEKGFIDLAKACEDMRDVVHSFEVTHIEGMNDYIVETAKTICKHIHLHIHQNLTTQQISSLLHKVDCCFLPSIYELFPLVMLESLAAGKPIFVTDVGICKEILSQIDLNLILDDSKPSEIKKKILWYVNLSHSKRNVLSRRCRRIALRFSKEEFGKNVRNVFEKFEKYN